MGTTSTLGLCTHTHTHIYIYAYTGYVIYFVLLVWRNWPQRKTVMKNITCSISPLHEPIVELPWPLNWRHNGRGGVSITSLTIVYSAVYSGADERIHQSSASLAFVGGIHRWPVNSPHRGPVTRKMFSFYYLIMPICKTWSSTFSRAERSIMV